METEVISLEERAKDEAKSYLEELLSEGARKLLQRAIENEVAEYLAIHQERRTDAGQRAIVRNGHHPERELVTGIGPIKVRQPRIRHLRLAKPAISTTGSEGGKEAKPANSTAGKSGGRKSQCEPFFGTIAAKVEVGLATHGRERAIDYPAHRLRIGHVQ